MDNRKMNAQNTQISYDKKEISEINYPSISICKDDIHHGAIDLSLIRDEYLFEIFESAVDAYLARYAVIYQNKGYSYKEIDSNTNRFAWYLRERVIQNSDKVDLIIENSAELYIAMLEIMKSDAAYVLIDSGYPPDRVKSILESSEVSLTITSSSIAGFFGLYDNTFLIDHERDIIDKFSDKRFERTETGVTSNDLYYMIFTSGSIRHPKRVQVEHKSVCNLVRALQKIYRINLGERIYQGFTVALDALIEKILIVFGHGATLVPSAPEIQKVGFDLGRLLNDSQITILSSEPTFLFTMTKDIPSLGGNDVIVH
jgi:non-ribosomal peptide synthetase component F